MRIITVLFAAILLASTPLIAYAKVSKLGVSTEVFVSNYQCDNGTKASAIYYSLSDKSLHFVKLTLNGVNYTLPALSSASGARYTDERKEWWIKGDNAMLNENVGDDKSKQIVCRTVSAAKRK